MDDSDRFKTLAEEVNTDVVEIAKELELEPEVAAETLQYHDKTFMDKEFLLMDKQRVVS